MGFSGDLIFGRSECPLVEAPVFSGLHEEVRDGIHAWWPRPGGWQTLQLDHGLWEAADLAALVEWSGAAACCASVYDSDTALVTGLGTDGRQWDAYLHLELLAASEAGDLWAEEPEGMGDMSVWVTTPAYAAATRRKLAELDATVPADARAALAWAANAGFPGKADPASIEAVLRSHEAFVEESFTALLDRLGFPAAVDPADHLTV